MIIPVFYIVKLSVNYDSLCGIATIVYDNYNWVKVIKSHHGSIFPSFTTDGIVKNRINIENSVIPVYSRGFSSRELSLPTTKAIGEINVLFTLESLLIDFSVLSGLPQAEWISLIEHITISHNRIIYSNVDKSIEIPSHINLLKNPFTISCLLLEMLIALKG